MIMGKSNQNHWRLCRDCVKVEIEPPRHTYGKKLLNTRRRFIGNLCNHGNRQKERSKIFKTVIRPSSFNTDYITCKKYRTILISEKKIKPFELFKRPKHYQFWDRLCFKLSTNSRQTLKELLDYGVIKCQVTWERTWSIQAHLFTLAVVLSRFIRSKYRYINWRRTKGQEQLIK